MKEIKFRAWSKTLCKYVDKDCVLINGYGRTYELLCVGTVDYDDDYIIEQYIGLRDKNGKEIYEGDILQKYEGGGIGYVSCDEDSLTWSFIEKLLDCPEGGLIYNLVDLGDGKEVIGNIHENPELLGEKE